MTAPAFERWAVVELLGHRVRYGRVSDVTLFGEAFCKVEQPTDPPTVEYYSGKALYGLRPASEDAIRAYHAPRKALTAIAEDFNRDEGPIGGDDDYDREDDDPPGVACDANGEVLACGGCGKPIADGEPTEDVADDNDDVELWHERCAIEHATRVAAEPTEAT